MRPSFRGLPWVLVLGLACSGHKEPQVPPTPDPMAARQLTPSLKAEAQPVVAGNTAFACDLYAQLRGGTGNIFCSPYSISTALAMTFAGARGVTEQEMARVFHFDLPQERLHSVFGALQQSLDTGTTFEGYRLAIANRLWGAQGMTWQAPFLSITRTAYGAELQPTDFAGNPESARQLINGWVGAKTAGLVPDLLPQGSVDRDTRLVLTNAIYFKGRWASQFDSAQTRNVAFQRPGSTAVTVPFMHQTQIFQRAKVEGAQLVRLPYQGKDLSMLLLVPDGVDGLPALEARLGPATLAEWRGRLQEGQVSLALPRFKFSQKLELAGVLGRMGMPSAFKPTADFSGMTGSPNLMLGGVYHQGAVEVNEEGTVAAAATGVVVAPTAVQPLVVDRPFLFMIVDEVTGSLLFLGRVVDPS